MVSSLRMGKGDVVDATDGKGSVFKVEVEDVSGKRVAGRILDIREEARPRPEIHVFLAVVKIQQLAWPGLSRSSGNTPQQLGSSLTTVRDISRLSKQLPIELQPTSTFP